MVIRWVQHIKYAVLGSDGNRNLPIALEKYFGLLPGYKGLRVKPKKISRYLAPVVQRLSIKFARAIMHQNRPTGSSVSI